MIDFQIPKSIVQLTDTVHIFQIALMHCRQYISNLYNEAAWNNDMAGQPISW